MEVQYLSPAARPVEFTHHHQQQQQHYPYPSSSSSGAAYPPQQQPQHGTVVPFSPMEQMEELDVVAAYCNYEEDVASLEKALGIDFNGQPQQATK